MEMGCFPAFTIMRIHSLKTGRELQTVAQSRAGVAVPMRACGGDDLPTAGFPDNLGDLSLAGLSGNSHAQLPFDAWPGVEQEGPIPVRKDPPSEICLPAAHGQEPPRVSDPERPGPTARPEETCRGREGRGGLCFCQVFGGAS